MRSVASFSRGNPNATTKIYSGSSVESLRLQYALNSANKVARIFQSGLRKIWRRVFQHFSEIARRHCNKYFTSNIVYDNQSQSASTSANFCNLCRYYSQVFRPLWGDDDRVDPCATWISLHSDDILRRKSTYSLRKKCLRSHQHDAKNFGQRARPAALAEIRKFHSSFMRAKILYVQSTVVE